MTFVVTWSLVAVMELGRVAGASADPSAVDREAVWMDSILRRYPFAMGEARTGRDRIWYADRIGILYRVDDIAMTVVVISVGPSRRH